MEKKPFIKSKKLIMIFFLLLIFWVIIDAKVTFESVLIGATASVAIIYINRDMLFSKQDSNSSIFRFLRYYPILLAVLIVEIIKSNIQVAKVVLSPQMPIEPTFVTIPVTPKKEFNRFLYGNVINLTPGTIVIDIKDGSYLIHALNKHNADALHHNKLEQLVLRLEVKE